MDAERLLAPEDTSPLGRSRADVLDMLRDADGPLGIREVALRMGLHSNTARFHLEALVQAGLAVRETEERQRPGRPRIGYRAAADGPAGRRRYRLLAEMLTSLISATMPEPGGAAKEAGREWGAYLTEQPPPYQRLTAEEAVARLTAIMAELGFSPQAETGDDGTYRLCLRQCPFREVAQHHQDVICSLHLGLMRGALARMRAPLSAERLDPFVKPGLCVARLAEREAELAGLPQHSRQDGGLAEVEFLGGGQQRHRPVRGQGADPAEGFLRARFAEFGCIAAAEFTELSRVVVVPGPQFGGWRDVLSPVIQPGGVLAQPSRPHPVHQDTGSVLRGGFFIDAPDPDVSAHRVPPSPLTP
jgi:predicted ArsR family transcriptional regulator